VGVGKMHGGAGEGPSRAADGEYRRRVGEIIHFRMTGRVDELLRHFARDVVLHYNCTKEGLFQKGVWIGHEAFRENLRRTDVDYEPLDAEILDVLVDGEKSAVRWRSAWRHRGTGGVYAMDMAHFLTWRDGVVVELHEFLDHHALSCGQPCCLGTLEDLLTPRPPGLSREEIVRRSIALVRFPSRGPAVALIRELCSPDIICEFIGDRARIPYAGRHIGRDALSNIVRSIAVDFEQLHDRVHDLVVDGGRVAGRRRVEWRHRGTGRRGMVDLADFVRFENGLIVELVEYRDTISMLEMQD